MGTYWFHTRHGSRWYISRGNAKGEPILVRVARTTFLRRVASTEEREVSIRYDAKRNTGTSTVRSGYYGRTSDGDKDLLPCPVR